MNHNRAVLALQPLEDRLAPATFSAARVAGTLVVTQIHPVSGAVRIYDDPAGGFVSVADETNGFVLDRFEIASRNLVVRLAPTDATRSPNILSAPGRERVTGLRNSAARTRPATGGADRELDSDWGRRLIVTNRRPSTSPGAHLPGRCRVRHPEPGGRGHVHRPDPLRFNAVGTSLGRGRSCGVRDTGGRC